MSIGTEVDLAALWSPYRARNGQMAASMDNPDGVNGLAGRSDGVFTSCIE